MEILDTYNKALKINLDATIFGTFAEIGAGQETARWFLRVGAASGTVAKTISAYDKTVSDVLYGAGERYVSKQRLESMLTAEWSILQEKLVDRAPSTRMFVFANTVSARNFAGTNQCHGWVGLRFLPEQGLPPHDIILHVNLLDPTNISQQEALGTLGVNLLYAGYFELEDDSRFLSAVGRDLGIERIQIDFIETRGQLLDEWDPKRLFIALVASGLSETVLLSRSDKYRPLNEAFYKVPVVIEPGKFEQRERIHTEMLAAALEHADAERSIGHRRVLGVFCLCASDSPGASGAPLLSTNELSVRANHLLSQGFDVLLTVHHDFYRISTLVRRFTTEQVRYVMGISTLVKLFATSYSELHGRILEALSQLFTEDVRTYVYPMALDVLQKRLTAEEFHSCRISDTDGLVEADEITPLPPLQHLHSYLLASGLLEPLRLDVKTQRDFPPRQ